jgi:hypothetical protein
MGSWRRAVEHEALVAVRERERVAVDGDLPDERVTESQTASADFRRLWAEHEVAVRRANRKTLLHPRVGRLTMDCETLITPDQRQQLLVLTPADAETRERLELLRVLGIEEFPTRAAGTPVR